MECPYCGAELKLVDYYGKRKFADHYYEYPRSWIDKVGDIYNCPNSDGFDDLDEAQSYQETEEDQTDLELEDVMCYSDVFNGYFYTDECGNLQEGYPC